jgi:acyl carrier protein
VNDLVGAKSRGIALLQCGQSTTTGVGGEDSSTPARWIFRPLEGNKEDGTESDPQHVEWPESPRPNDHDSYNTGRMERSEIEQTLITLVRKEKDLPNDKLTPDTVLADAGIDSLDSLTILFAIEEHFKISISDTRAREIKTFGDMIDVVAELLPAAQ